MLGGNRSLQPRTISQITFYLFSPCLVFDLLTHSQLRNEDVLRIIGFAAAVMVLVGFCAWLAGRLLRLERRLLAAVMVSAMFMNAGNYGMPLVDFAFGEQALVYAGLYFVGMNVMTNSLGVLVASLGTKNLAQALLNLLRMPVIYAVILGSLFLSLGWALPLPVERAVNLLGKGAIPCMLIFMGMQLRTVRLQGHRRELLLVCGLRLLLAPLIAFFLSPYFGLEGYARQAGLVESAMPTAVFATILANEFEIEPAFVAAVVFVTTLLSIFTLTPLLVWLGA